VNNWSEFVKRFMPEKEKDRKSTHLSNAVYGFFENEGSRCFIINTGEKGDVDDALVAAEIEDEIAIVAAPGFTDPASHAALKSHCEKLEDRVAILDTPDVDDIGPFDDVETAPVPKEEGGSARGGRRSRAGGGADEGPQEGGLLPAESDRGFTTVYFPWITVLDPIEDVLVNVPPSGHMAGIWARTDAERGVHKAPANEAVNGALNLTKRLTRDEQAVLNDLGVNCLRLFARSGIRVWGARTRAAAASEWRYLNVRRLFNMIEESIVEGTTWIVFEPNCSAPRRTRRSSSSATRRPIHQMSSTPARSSRSSESRRSSLRSSSYSKSCSRRPGHRFHLSPAANGTRRVHDARSR
jgi:hypothetical protein